MTITITNNEIDNKQIDHIPIDIMKELMCKVKYADGQIKFKLNNPTINFLHGKMISLKDFWFNYKE